MGAPSAIKRIFVGRPMSSGELEHTLLPKTIALPVFASDPLSSNAYATQEILLTLGLAGTAALHFVLPISIAVACLLAIVVTSYRQTVRAYPTGGGAYRVSSENLGKYAGLLAASALLLDYILTVSVSITAGTDAVISAAPAMADHKISLAMLFIAFVTLMNLRGVKESGSLFAIPTYGFVLCIYVLLTTGFIKCLGGCPQAASAGAELEHVTSAVSWLLILKAFAAGTTALTGVEAIADGVQAFRFPQSKNAATTLAIMGGLAASMFLGISWLADHTNVVYAHGDKQTVVAQISHAVFGGGFMFYLLQALTAGILILAANTAYADFPRLSSILAHDSFMPRQFKSRGDRLVFSNGVLILATLAATLIVIFKANLNDLIQLYLVGVFISFTLSQSGMFLRWRRLKGKNWQRSAAINGFGALVTGTVFWVIVSQKFLEGAWVVIAAIPVLMYFMHSVHKHYTDVEHQLSLEERRPTDRRPGNQNVVILVRDLDAATTRAVGYVRSTRPASITAVGFDQATSDAWRIFAPDIPMTILEGKTRTDSVRKHLRQRRVDLTSDDFLTLAIPELLHSQSLFELVRSARLQRLKAALLFEKDIQVMDIPMFVDDIDPAATEIVEPARNYVFVLVARTDNATLHAVEYAETLRGTDLRCISFGLDPEETERLGDLWLGDRMPHPLELEAAPFRDIGASVGHFVKDFRPDGVNRVVTVVLPEFIVGSPRHQLLHNQTALVVKRRLLFLRGVVVVSVPYHLER